MAARWAGVETIAFAEIDSYASRVLQKHWPNVRNYGNVRNVPALDAWLVTGGVPCQPASVAGKRRGAEDDRWLWPEALAAIERIRPAWVLFENPTGILSLNDGVEFERICAAMEGQGYEVQPLVIPACGVGAPHRRNRVWVVGRNPNAIRCGGNGWTQQEIPDENSDANGVCKNVSDACHARSSCARFGNEPQKSKYRTVNANREAVAHAESEQAGRVCIAGLLPNAGASGHAYTEGRNGSSSEWWSVEPNMGRVAHGIPKRVDRLRGLGNAIVPQVAHQLIKWMIQAGE